MITGGVDERDVPFKLITTIGTGRPFDQIPWLVLIAFAVGARRSGSSSPPTRFGRYTYAVGSNEEAARRAGVNVDRHLMKVYALAGHARRAGRLPVAGALRHDDDRRPRHRQPARPSPPSSSAAPACSAASARSSAPSSACFIPAVLQNGFVIVGVQPFWQRSPSARC